MRYVHNSPSGVRSTWREGRSELPGDPDHRVETSLYKLHTKEIITRSKNQLRKANILFSRVYKIIIIIIIIIIKHCKNFKGKYWAIFGQKIVRTTCGSGLPGS
jgi:hypothetical protein